MTRAERTELRRLQDRFLALPSARAWATAYGEDEPLCGRGRPSTAELRQHLYPAAREWLERSLIA